MLDVDKEKLNKAADNHEWLSVGVDRETKLFTGVFVPWELTASAFNMKTPDIMLTVDDLSDSDIINKLSCCQVIGIYIFTSLKNYSFLSQFHQVRDLFVLHGENIIDLSFVKNMPDLYMVYIENANLPNLDPLIENYNSGNHINSARFGFAFCDIVDTSALKKMKYPISELLVWCKNNRDELRDCWKPNVCCGRFKIYQNDFNDEESEAETI